MSSEALPGNAIWVVLILLVGALLVADDFFAPGIEARRAATQCGSREPDPKGAPVFVDVRRISPP